MTIFIIFGIEMYGSNSYVDRVVTKKELAEAAVSHGRPIDGLYYEEHETEDEFVEKYIMNKDQS